MSSDEHMSESSDRSQSTLAWLIDEHTIAIAILLYVIGVTPLWWWMVGYIGIDGVVSGPMAGIALAIGALMFVPGIMVWLRQKKFDLGFAEAQQVKDRLIVDTTDQTGDSQTADRFRTGAADTSETDD